MRYAIFPLFFLAFVSGCVSEEQLAPPTTNNRYQPQVYSSDAVAQRPAAVRPIINEGAWCISPTRGSNFIVEVAVPTQNSPCYRTQRECNQFSIRGTQACTFNQFLTPNRF